jgi:uncharacterized protein YycO
VRPGDLLIVKTTGIAARVIQWGTHSRYNHAAIYVGTVNGVETLIEANPSGIEAKSLSEYASRQYLVSDYPLSDAQRKRIVAFAYAQIGKRYGWLDIAALVLLSLGIRWRWVINTAMDQTRFVCSQLACEAAWHGGWDVTGNGEPWSATPGDMEESGFFVRSDMQDAAR